jgi:hypothetical protein
MKTIKFALETIDNLRLEKETTSAQVRILDKLRNKITNETPEKFYSIIGAHIHMPIGATTYNGIADVKEEEPHVTFVEISKDKYLKVFNE